jgi:hypothetical protein
VYRGIVEVTTRVESAGQLVTVGAQLVMVTSLVVKTVDVVHCEALAKDVMEPVTGEDPDGPRDEVAPEGPDGLTGELVGELAGNPRLELTGDVCRGVESAGEV